MCFDLQLGYLPGAQAVLLTGCACDNGRTVGRNMSEPHIK
jgi:hypothetical protein